MMGGVEAQRAKPPSTFQVVPVTHARSLLLVVDALLRRERDG
jgi:hypothetical protein